MVYLGCYIDTRSDRAMPEIIHQYSHSLTVETCIEGCALRGNVHLSLILAVCSFCKIAVYEAVTAI